VNIQQLKKFCEGTPLVVHNAQFESKWLLSRSIDPYMQDDTLMLAYLVDERLPLDLESLCLRFGVDTVFKEEYGKEVAKITGQRLIDRNTRDARNTLLLRDILWSKLTKREQLVYNDALLPATKSLAQIELNGVCYSPKRVKELVKDLSKRIIDINLPGDKVIKEFTANSGKEFNVDSWIHKGMVIYDMLGYEPLPFKQAYTDTGNPSTNVKILRKLYDVRENKTLDKIIHASSYSSWRETYANLDKYCKKCERPHTIKIDGKWYVFSSLGLGDTTTGRVKSSHPNMQNNPSRFGGSYTRRVFVPRTGVSRGCILEADYAGIELRILAGVSGDERLIDDFIDGKDPHEEMARIAFKITRAEVSKKERAEGKTLNYAIPFGAGVDRIALDTGRTRKEAKMFLDLYWEQHPELRRFLGSVPQDGIVTSCSGMKRHCSTWTQGKNFHTQNPALVALLVALNRVVPAMQERAPVALCVHDSSVFDVANKNKVKDLVSEIREMMEFDSYEIFSELPIPLTVDFKIGSSWGEMIDYDDYVKNGYNYS